MEYRALTRGFANGKIIEPDEQFEFEGPQGTWMERVDNSPPAKAEATPSQATATAPSTDPAPDEHASLDDLLKFAADNSNDIKPEEFTEKGFLRKSAFEKRLGRAVPQGVFLSYIKHVTETRTAAN